MRKILSFLLATILVFGLCACGNKAASNAEQDANPESVDTSIVETEDGYLTYLVGENAGKFIIPEDKANTLIENALAQEVPDGGVLLKNLGGDEEFLYNTAFNFNQDQFFARFTYFLAKFGKDAYASQTAEVLDSINYMRESGENRYYVSNNALVLTFDDGASQTISFFGTWGDETGKEFFTLAVLPALYATIGEPEEAALKDAKLEREENASCISAEGLYKMDVSTYTSNYTFSIKPCPVNELVDAGYAIEDLNYIVVY